MSVLFFTGLSRIFGDTMLGQIILLQSAAAIVLVACTPQGWVYVIGARDRNELGARYRCAFTAEILGIAVGATILIVFLALPIAAVDQWRDGALAIFASLAIQCMGSCLAWLRATESWYRFTLWNVGPNLIRVPLIWATPWLLSHGWIPDAHSDRGLLIAIYFLTPDILRLLTVAMPIALRHYRWPGIVATKLATKVILQNWLFDIGSAITEIADKVVVGAFVGPQSLVAYFFARKVGVAITMVTEPYFAEHYRRISVLDTSLDRTRIQRRIYGRGVLMALALVGLIIVSLFFIMKLPFTAELLPLVVQSKFMLFAAVLFVDSQLAANRWSRFSAQLSGSGVELLMVRLAIFALFASNVWAFGVFMSGTGLVLALVLSWALEAGYLWSRLKNTAARCSRTAL